MWEWSIAMWEWFKLRLALLVNGYCDYPFGDCDEAGVKLHQMIVDGHFCSFHVCDAHKSMLNAVKGSAPPAC